MKKKLGYENVKAFVAWETLVDKKNWVSLKSSFCGVVSIKSIKDLNVLLGIQKLQLYSP